VQVLEAVEQLAAMKAWQEADKDHLRAWIKERNGGKPFEGPEERAMQDAGYGLRRIPF
jgi:hypothetical protein